MDNQKLADLLFPEELKTPEYYEEKFPYRKLPKGAEVLQDLFILATFTVHLPMSVSHTEKKECFIFV